MRRYKFGDLLEETTVDLPPGEQDDTIAVRVDRPSLSLATLERGVHVPERDCLWRNSAASVCKELRMILCPSVATSSSPAPTGNAKVPIYNLTTGQPLPDVKGEGNLAIHFDNPVFHSLFLDAELAIVRIPTLPPIVPHPKKSPDTKNTAISSSPTPPTGKRSPRPVALSSGAYRRV